MVTIEANNEELNVIGDISFTRQAGDIGDVATSNANFTNSFTVIRDKSAIRSLKGLSLPGSNSDIPYLKTIARLKYNGLSLIRKGWLNIMEADNDFFKISVLDGNIDFWKAIEGVTLEDINLDLARHEKNLTNIIDSVDNPYYRYLLADYGGQTDTETNTYNIAHLPPSINELYIFNQIFAFIGMSYQMTPVIDTWLTYPKESGEDLGFDDPNIFTVRDGTYDIDFNWGAEINYDAVTSVNGMVIIETEGATGFQTGNYDINFQYEQLPTAEYELEQQLYGDIVYQRLPVRMAIKLGNDYYFSNQVTAVRINPSDVVSIAFIAYEAGEDVGWSGYAVESVQDLDIRGFTVNVTKYIFEEINFANALKNIKATDFVKYIMHRFALTLFYENKNVEFMTIAERLSAPTQFFKDKFIERNSERYIYSHYAQRNLLAHKYVNDDKGFNDGVIVANNRNLPEERKLLESFTYSPTRDGKLINFTTEVKESKDGEITVDYKWVDRNFSVKSKTVNQTTTFYSEIEENEITVTGLVNVVDLVGTSFREYKNMYYGGIERLINNSIIHKIKMNLSFVEFMNVDLKEKIYIEEEASEYLINSISIKNYDVDLELIKIK